MREKTLALLTLLGTTLSALAQTAQPTPTAIPLPTPLSGVPTPSAPPSLSSLTNPGATPDPVSPPQNLPTPGPVALPTPLADVPLPASAQSAAEPFASPQATPTPVPEPTPLALPTPEPLPVPPNEPLAPLPLPSPEASGTPVEATISDFPDLLKGDPSLTPQGLSSFPTVQAEPKEAASTLRTLQYAQKIRNQRIERSGVPSMNIEQAISTALQDNPDVLNAVEQVRVTSGQLISVRSQILPKVVVNSSYQYQQSTLTPNRSGGSNTVTIPGDPPITINLGGGGSSSGNEQAWNIQFQGQQLLFDGGAAVAGIQAANFAQNLSYFQLRETIDTVVSQVKQAFYQVVLNRALIKAQAQSVALLESQLIDQQNRYEAGTVPRFNVLQAEVALANAIPPLINAQNNLRISEYQLVRLLGMDYNKARLSEVPFNVVGELTYRLREINIDNSIKTALGRNPGLKAQRQNILAQASNVTVARSGFFPQINASGGYQWQNDQTSQNLGATLEGWFLGVTGSWAIFDGLETYGNTKQAIAQLKQSKISYDNGVRQVVLDVQQAVSNLQNARETIDSQQASVVQAIEALRLAQERLNAGAGTQLDVLNAQVALLQAQTTEFQARYDYIAATAQYDQVLSLDTQYQETFDDPLTRPESRRYHRITSNERPQPNLPGRMKNEDPLAGIVTPEPKSKKKPAAKPTPTPKPTRSAQAK